MNLRMIPTKVHGVLDYLHGSALLAAPELLRLKGEPRATLVSGLAGGGATTYTLMTDFELGAVKAIPMPAHLALDAASGALFASERDPAVLREARPGLAGSTWAEGVEAWSPFRIETPRLPG